MDIDLANSLGLSLSPPGKISSQCLMGKLQQDTYKAIARIMTESGINELECLVSMCRQELAMNRYDTPTEWMSKYNIKRFTESPHGTNLIII